MKISQKLVRRTFLLLSPLLLATTMKQCEILEFLFTLLCLLGPPGFIQNAVGYTPQPEPESVYVGDGGEIYRGEGVYSCDFSDLIVVPGRPNLNDITFFGVEGIGNIIVGNNGTIVQLDSLQINIISSPAGTQNLNAIHRVSNAPNVVAAGDSGTVIKSTDNGLSWSAVNFPFTDNLKTVFMYSSDHIVVGGESYSAYQTFDGGETWEPIGIGANFSSVGPTSFNAIFFYDDSVGYIGGPWGLMGKTTDGGANWTTLAAPDFEEINDLFFISPDSGVAVGSPGIVRFTTDGGSTWEEDPEVTNLIGGKTIKQIAVIDEVSGRIIGEDGLNIIFTTDSTLLSVHNEDGNHIHNYSLSNNYPNPFNPSTIIEYNLPQYGFVTLKVYDILGKEIATLVNEEKAVGSYEIEYDATNLPSGIYFYRIQAGSFIETKKMVLLR